MEKNIQLVDFKELTDSSQSVEKEENQVENLELILHEEDFQDFSSAENMSLLFGMDNFFAA
ncbi:MAG: hypothetical protein ACYTFY_08390 [Planctomycetota bacterium]